MRLRAISTRCSNTRCGEQAQSCWPSGNRVTNLKPLRVGVALAGLTAQGDLSPTCFDKPKAAKFVGAIDEMNEKFGKRRAHLKKIAFQRVPKA
jgi:hypothetical protein